MDKSMTKDGYGELANLLDVTKCNEFLLKDCDLNKNKLARLSEECLKGNLKIQGLIIIDKSMTEDGHGALANLLHVTKCNKLQLKECDLTKRKLAELSAECQKENMKIQSLLVMDKSMTEDGYGELANLLNVTKCNELQLKDCDLDKNKLNELSEECLKGNVKIQKLAISDKSMTKDGYGNLANLLNATKCDEFHLVNCDLNKNKLAELSDGCQKGDVKIQRLVVMDRSITEDGYGELANLLNVTKCNELQLEDCDLDKNKLAKLSAKCQKGNMKIRKLIVADKSMTKDGYGELANLLSVTKCNEFHLANCDLNKNKLAELTAEWRKINVKKMDCVYIYENHTIASDEEVSALCELMTNGLRGLGLHNWEIDARGIQRLKETFHHQAPQMIGLQLPNEELVRKPQ